LSLRHTGNSHHAEEIAQAVFVILAKKSGQLGRRVVLSGWICENWLHRRAFWSRLPKKNVFASVFRVHVLCENEG